MNWYTIYGSKQCKYCTKAAELLESHGLAHVEVDIEKLPEIKEAVKEAGFTTIPIIYYTDDTTNQLIGGYQEFKEHLNGC